MSDALLISGFEACIRRLVEERNRADFIPLHVAFCRPEGPGANMHAENLFLPLLGHCDYTPRSIFSSWPADVFAVAFHTPRDRGFVPSARVNALIQQADALAEELQTLCNALPAGVRQALCLPELRDWWRTLFHLAWHFDRPFLSSHRDRLLSCDKFPTIRVDETCIQQSGCGGRQDVLPGLIFGTLKHDALTASEAAAGLLLESLRNHSPGTSSPQGVNAAEVFAQLRDQFRQRAEAEAQMPGPKTNVKLLRFSDSFRTPPATEWASLEIGGQVESFWRLARINADQEFCQIRGPATHVFNQLATQAGNALPRHTPDSAALFVEERRLANGFVMQMSGPTPILSPGPVERWLRFVFSTLKQFCPDELQIEWGTATGATSYGMATLKQNIFASSALAIELTNLTLVDYTRSAGLCFEDFPASPLYPPPAVGRYVLYSYGFRPGTGERERRPAWTWTERPVDGWVECGECDSDSGRVLIAKGRPPALCDWLPSDWPAAFFPLGRTVEHCAGWRGLVRGVLGHEQDTIPPDDLEYGWRTLTRATRYLAHHLRVIPLERLIAPLPASRAEARREVEPLLDGLIHVHRADPAANSAEDSPEETSGKPGRPPDDRKQEIVKYVRKLREDKTPWKEIPDAVFDKFKVRYTAETLRGYLKSG